MGKGDQKSKRGKITAGSYGKRRPRRRKSVNKIPVKVMDENEDKKSVNKVREEVGYPSGKSENAESGKAKTASKTAKNKKTEE